jgi:hypothetical protein
MLFNIFRYYGNLLLIYKLYHVIRTPRYIKTICQTYHVGCTSIQEPSCIYTDRSLIKGQQNVLVADHIYVYYYYELLCVTFIS